MPTPVYPSLSSYGGALTDPREVIPSILRFMYATPAARSDFFENRLEDHKLSLVRIEADYGHNPDAFMQKLSDELTVVLNRYFPDYGLKINLYYKLITEDGKEDEVDPTEDNQHYPRYNVYIDIVRITPNGVVIGTITRGRIEVDNVEHKFSIHFDKEVV